MFLRARLAVVAVLVVTAGFSVARADRDSDVANESSKFEGTWKVVGVEKYGRQAPTVLLEQLKEINLVVRQGRLTVFVSGVAEDEQTLEINPVRRPRELDFNRRVGGRRVKFQAIYKFKAGLKICFNDDGSPRPINFRTKENRDITVMTLMKE